MMPAGLINNSKAEPTRQGFIYEFQKSLTRKQLVDLILLEHTYAKPSSLDPDFNRIHSTDILLLSRSENNEVGDEQQNIDELDILEVLKPEQSLVGYDKMSAASQMSELENCFQSLVKEETWQEDEALSRIGWTRDQTKLHDQVLKVLSTYQLARCTYKGNDNEEILRHAAITKAAKRFRYIAAGVTWDTRAMSWLHSVLIDGLNPSLFLCYLELLQVLISKVPSLVEKMIQNSTAREDKAAILTSVSIMNCLRKKWDPSPSIVSKKEKKKIQESEETATQNKPLLLMLPRGPCLNLIHPKRFTFWQKQLSNVTKTAPINVHCPDKDADFGSSAYLENIIGIARTRIFTSYSKCPGRPVVLIGWSVGALLACQISLLESVSGVICLGYPCNGLDGLRQVDCDPCLDVKCPVMFVIGTHSATCSTNYIESLREKMRVDTRLLIVPGGDEVLKLTSSHKKRVKMTQNMVDRLIMDDIEEFISGLQAKPDKSKDITRPNTPLPGIQPLQMDRKRKHKKGEFEKEVVEKKKKKSPPVLKKPIMAVKRDASDYVYDASKGKGIVTDVSNAGAFGIKEGIMTPSELTKAATRNIASNASSGEETTPGLTPSPAILSSLMSTKHPDKIPISRHGLKSQHPKMNEKMLKKLKMNKKPLHMTRPMSPQNPTGLTSIQQFPATSSILLSSSSAKVRLQDGRILCLQGSDSDFSSHDSQTFISTMSTSTKPPTPIGITSNNRDIHTAQLQSMLAAKSSISTVGSSFNQRSLLVSPQLSSSAAISQQSASFVGFANFVNNSNVSTRPDSETVSSPSATHGTASPATIQTTQLTPTDLKYLAKLFEKSNESTNEGLTVGKTQEKPSGIPTSPISAKIGIGTLTNLPNSDGSPPGSGTRASPSSKQLSAKDPKDLVLLSGLEAPKMKSLLAKNQSTGNKPLTFPKRDLFDKQKMASKSRMLTKPQSGIISINTQTSSHQLKNLPVTVTIPAHNSSRLVVSSNNKSQPEVLKQGVTTASAQSLLTQQRLILSSASTSQQTNTTKSTVELSQLIRKVTPTSSSIFEAVNNRQMSSSSKLTVTGRPIQTSPLSKKNPQTITLHIPNSAMLKDHGTLRKSGSEIKLIGLLNQKGRSPMTSPIHFSVQSRSAPGSPKAQSPTIVLTSKSDPPTPKADSRKQDGVDIVARDDSSEDKAAGGKCTEISTDADALSSKAVPFGSNASVIHKALQSSTIEADSKVVIPKPATNTSAGNAAAPHASATNASATNASTTHASTNVPASATSVDAEKGTNSVISAGKDAKAAITKPIVSNTTIALSKQQLAFSRPATVQTTLLRSLSAATLSPQQQESISTLLRSSGTKKLKGSASKFLNDSSKIQNKEEQKSALDLAGDSIVKESGKDASWRNQSVKIRHTDIDVVNGHIVSADKSGLVSSDQRKSNANSNETSKRFGDNTESQLPLAARKEVSSGTESISFSRNSKETEREKSQQNRSIEGKEGDNPNQNKVVHVKSRPTISLNNATNPMEFKECAVPLNKVETVRNAVRQSDSIPRLKNQELHKVEGKKLDVDKNENGVNLNKEFHRDQPAKDKATIILQGRDNAKSSGKTSADSLSEENRRKRHREEPNDIQDFDSSEDEEDKPIARLVRKVSSVNDRKKVSTPQKTEE